MNMMDLLPEQISAYLLIDDLEFFVSLTAEPIPALMDYQPPEDQRESWEEAVYQQVKYHHDKKEHER